jgi:hypothetical protein
MVEDKRAVRIVMEKECSVLGRKEDEEEKD